MKQKNLRSATGTFAGCRSLHDTNATPKPDVRTTKFQRGGMGVGAVDPVPGAVLGIGVGAVAPVPGAVLGIGVPLSVVDELLVELP